MGTLDLLIGAAVSAATSATIVLLGIWFVKKLISHKLSIISAKTETRIKRIDAFFEQSIESLKEIHALISKLRKDIELVFYLPKDRPQTYNSVEQHKIHLVDQFNKLDLLFQGSRVHLMIINQDLFEMIHHLKSSLGLIIKRYEDIVSTSEFNSFSDVHAIMNGEKMCKKTFNEMEEEFRLVEKSIRKTIKQA
jgi:hypothetical protein